MPNKNTLYYLKLCLFFIGFFICGPLEKSSNSAQVFFNKDAQSEQAFDAYQIGLKQRMKLATHLYRQKAFEKAELELITLQRQLLVWQETKIGRASCRERV